MRRDLRARVNGGNHNNGHDVSELRAWSRRAWWAGYKTRRQKLRALAEVALTPWRATRDIVRVWNEYGPYVSSQFGVPRHRQLLDAFRARLHNGLEPLAFYRLQLFRPERARETSHYIQSTDTGPLLRWLSTQTPGYPRVFVDKRHFAAWCVRHGLPSVSTLMEFEGGRMTWSHADDGSLPHADLFSKPTNWQSGNGAERWMWDGDGHYVGSDRSARDGAALVAELAQRSADLNRPVVLQRFLRTASAVADLTPGACCTARILTMGSPGGPPEVLLAFYRMPTGAEVAVDNFALGGLAAPIDVATGRLARAIPKDFRLLPAGTDRHPNTGAVIEGRQLPFWPEAVDLVLRGHTAIDWKGVPVIGWDVALLDEGPVLIEGNNVPCSTANQMIMGGPLGDTPFVACLNAHLRERFISPYAR
jgi:hypothetical protein